MRPPQLWLFFLLHSRFKRLATPDLSSCDAADNHIYEYRDFHMLVVNVLIKFHEQDALEQGAHLKLLGIHLMKPILLLNTDDKCSSFK